MKWLIYIIIFITQINTHGIIAECRATTTIIKRILHIILCRSFPVFKYNIQLYIAKVKITASKVFINVLEKQFKENQMV